MLKSFKIPNEQKLLWWSKTWMLVSCFSVLKPRIVSVSNLQLISWWLSCREGKKNTKSSKSWNLASILLILLKVITWTGNWKKKVKFTKWKSQPSKKTTIICNKERMITIPLKTFQNFLKNKKQLKNSWLNRSCKSLNSKIRLWSKD